MDRIYCEIPTNFAEIEFCVISKKEEVVKLIIQSKKCYFYDACSLRKHMFFPNPEDLFKYIKSTEGVVVITRCIIMELCSNDNKMWKEHIEYITKMHRNGIKVLIAYEEDLFETLNLCFSNIATTNTFLSFAVKNAKMATGTVTQTLKENTQLKKFLLEKGKSEDTNLAKNFFTAVRNNKKSDDNLGEELIAICMQFLANIPELCAYKYVMLTEDKGAITLLAKAINNVKKNTGKKCITAFTTPRLAQLMINKGIINEIQQIEEILVAGNVGLDIRIMCSQEYELSPVDKILSYKQLAKELIMNKEMRIYL